MLKIQDRLRQWDVWSKVRVLCGMNSIPPRFIDVTTFITPISKGKTAVSILSKLVLAATSYYIWLERNGRLFKKKTSSPDQIVDVITSLVWLKLVTFRFKKMSTWSRLLLDQWKIPSYCNVHDGSSRLDEGQSAAHILKYTTYLGYVGGNIINAEEKCGAHYGKISALERINRLHLIRCGDEIRITAFRYLICTVFYFK
nr:reverse transcriptase domain, reverse transcriptase zinc-binding domain protein [Tanacetum cinerariifolium]